MQLSGAYPGCTDMASLVCGGTFAGAAVLLGLRRLEIGLAGWLLLHLHRQIRMGKRC